MVTVTPVFPAGKVTLDVQLQLDVPPQAVEPLEVSVLLNSVLYFIESVMVVRHHGRYRLLAIHRGQVMADSTYDSSKGAKIAFLRIFGYKAWNESLTPDWTAFYSPDQKWIKKRIQKPKRK